MTSSPRRIAAIGLAVILIIGVGIGIISSVRSSLGPAPVTLTGVIGSEKAPSARSSAESPPTIPGPAAASVADEASAPVTRKPAP